MRRFFLVVLCIFAFTYGYLSWRLQVLFGPASWLLLAGLHGSILFYFVWARTHPHLSTWQKAYRYINFLNMGFLSFLLTLTLLRDLLFFPLSFLAPELSLRLIDKEGTLGVLVLSVAAVFIGYITALRGPKVIHIDIPLANLPEELQGFTIAQISDLHVGPTIGRRYVEKIVRQVNELKSHVTVLTGDIFDGRFEEHHYDAVPLAQLSPQGNILYVTGNHEYYWDGPKWIQWLEAQGMKALLNSNYIHEHNGHHVMFAGVVDPAVRMTDPQGRPDPGKAQIQSHSSQKSLQDINPLVKILLAHQPGIAHEASRLGFHLQLSGHTHAGQFFPWTLAVKKVHEFSKGLKSAGKMWVYVNSGTGSWGPPIRFGTTTEISLLRLVRDNP